MRIGLSFWGFLGSGVLDTPDGGRFWRRPIVDELLALGHDVVLLQNDRDRLEAGDVLPYQWHSGLPPVDVLFCEWRWPLPGRNTTPCGTDWHTCDLHRQTDLLVHYTITSTTPTVIWDTDRQLPADSPLHDRGNVIVCEPGLAPPSGITSLVHPVPDNLLDDADPVALAAVHRSLPLIYVGNQYNRDEEFDAFFAPAAARFAHGVAGKWTQIERWPHVNFTGRCPFPEVQRLHRAALATVLLNPARYSSVGHVSQRLFEAALAGCLPITPDVIAGAEVFTPPVLHVRDGREVIDRVEWALGIAGSQEHADLIRACLSHLEPFRLSAWTARLMQLIETLIHTTGAA